jgi:hypothetical protein
MEGFKFGRCLENILVSRDMSQRKKTPLYSKAKSPFCLHDTTRRHKI